MANLKETPDKLRHNFSQDDQCTDEAVGVFDRALLSVLLDLIEPTPEPKKRSCVRKPKPPATA